VLLMQPSIMLCSSSLARCTYVHSLASAAVHAVNIFHNSNAGVV